MDLDVLRLSLTSSVFHLPGVSDVSTELPQGSAPALESLPWGDFGVQGSVVGGPAGSTGVLPQGSDEESVGSKSQGWPRERVFPEGTGDQGSAEGPQEEPLGSVLGLRPEMAMEHMIPDSPCPFPVTEPRLGDVGCISQVRCRLETTQQVMQGAWTPQAPAASVTFTIRVGLVRATRAHLLSFA
jgi:hypothetical protein